MRAAKKGRSGPRGSTLELPIAPGEAVWVVKVEPGLMDSHPDGRVRPTPPLWEAWRRFEIALLDARPPKDLP